MKDLIFFFCHDIPLPNPFPLMQHFMFATFQKKKKKGILGLY